MSERLRESVSALMDGEAGELELRRLLTNADREPKEVRIYCKLDEAGNALIKAATRQLGLSARSFHRILKVSRTIADLSGSESIETTHLGEALQYRPQSRV